MPFIIDADEAATAIADGRGILDAVTSVIWLGVLGAGAIALFQLFAWLVARSTVYTITNRRLVFRAGVALPLSINIPFKQIAAVRLTTHGDGTGNLAVALRPAARIGYLYMWPHARPWHFSRTEPMFRCIPDAEHAGQVLRDALADFDAAGDTDPAGTGSAPANGDAPETAASESTDTTQAHSNDQPGGGSARAAAAAR